MKHMISNESHMKHLRWSKIDIDTKQSNKRDNQNRKTRQSHEINRHKWQDNMNLYKNQSWNQVLRKGKHFLLRMRHPLWCPLCRIKEWNVLMMATIYWPTDVVSHGGHWDTIRECQMMVMTKTFLVLISV